MMTRWFVLVFFLCLWLYAPAQDIMLNELSASVTNSQVDNYGEFEDWIEVFNCSKSDINLSGWYLSDNPAKPFKWCIPHTNPKITTIPAESYLLLWADNDTLQGPDHLGFSLNKKGESLLLYRPTQDGPVLEDSVSYGPLSPDHSLGRCPERQNAWIVFKHPTPGKVNICSAEKKRKTTKIPIPEPPGLLLGLPDIGASTEKGGIGLTINEICSNNRFSKLDEHGENDDWIELFNPGPVAINVAGWYFSDTLNTSVFHRIPSFDLTKTLIPAGGYMVLWADGQSAQGVTHLPFKLDKDGEAVYLFRLISGQYEMVDEVVFPKLKNDVTYGRIPNGTGAWKRLSDPTPMASNLPPRILSGFMLNELMAISGNGLTDDHGEQEDWVEFYNPTAYPVDLGGIYLTDSVEYSIKSHVSVYSPDSTTIPPGGFLLFFADNETWQGVRHLNFKLSSKGADISIFQPDGNTLISKISYPYQSADASFGRYPDGVENWIHTIPTPGWSNQSSFSFVDDLFVNEIMAYNQTSFPDDYGGHEDWIEIFNHSQAPVNLGGLYVTDSLSYPLKYRIPNTYPDSTTIPAKSYMILWADSHPELGVRHLDFKLHAGGESFGLVQVNGLHKEFLDSLTYPSQVTGESYGRIEDGEPVWGVLTVPSPGAPNSVQSLVDDNSTEASVQVYPNPSINRLNVRILLINSQKVQIEMYSAGGEKILSFDFCDCHTGWNLLAIENLKYSLSPGLYFLRILTGDQISHKTFQLLE